MAPSESVNRNLTSTFPIYPALSVYNRLAKLSSQLWLPEGTEAVWEEVSEIAGSEGVFAEHMVAALHTSVHHRLMICSYAHQDMTRSIDEYLRGLIPGPLGTMHSTFLANENLGVSSRTRRLILDAIGPTTFDITFILQAALRSPAHRVALMRAAIGYMAHLLTGMMVLDSEFQRYGSQPSPEACIFHRTRFAYAGAAICAEEIVSLAPSIGPAEDFARSVGVALTRAGLLISERPEAWQSASEEMLRDVTIPFLTTANFTAEGEARVYSGRSDIQFRRGSVGGDVFQRGVAEFKKWSGVSAFVEAWDQVTVQHATGHEHYLAVVMLYYGQKTLDVVTDMTHAVDPALVSVLSPRLKGSGTLAGMDGAVSVRGSQPIPFGVFVYEVGYSNPRRHTT